MSSEPSSRRLTLLRPSDQSVVAAMTLAALALLAANLLIRLFSAEGLAEIDDQAKRDFAFQIDINSAAWPEIAQLPGVGETLARRVVSSRQKEGPFRSAADLRRVRGIGATKLERIKPSIRPLE